MPAVHAAADFETVCELELGRILGILGPSQHLFVCGVSKTFHTRCHKPKDEATGDIQCRTSARAVFSSVSRLTMAVHSGLKLNQDFANGPGIFFDRGVRSLCMHYKAGRYGSIPVLQSAIMLGLVLSTRVLCGAVRTGHMETVRWLVEEHRVEMLAIVAEEAGYNGSVHMIEWLRTKGCPIDSAALRGAATGNYMALVLHLRSIGIE